MYTYTHLHRKRTLGVARRLSLLAASLTALPLDAQMGLGLTPMRQEFTAVPGTAHTGSLLLSNSDSTGVRVRTEILDFYVDDQQTPQFVAEAPAESAYSCRQWVSVNPMEIDLGAKAQLSIRYTVRVPAEAPERSYHCAVGFVGVPAATAVEQGFQLRTAVRVVATLYPLVGRPAVKGSIADLGLESVSSGTAQQFRGVVTLENTGWMLFRPTGLVEVVDGSGVVVEALSIVSFPVLPQRRQRFLLPLKKPLEAGRRYTLRARIDLGSEVQEATTEVSAEPRKL